MINGIIIHSHDEFGEFAYIEVDAADAWGNISPYTYEYTLGELPPHYPVPAIRLQETWCDDGAFMIHTDGDIMAIFPWGLPWRD